MSVLVVCQDFPMCNDLSTPHIPPEGVLSQAGYGAPCEKTPCLPGMSCCYNGRYKAVCEGKQLTVSPRQEATWLITEGGLSSELTSHGLYGENVFQMTG